MNDYNTITLAAQGNREAREKLVAENSPLVWSIVRRFSGRGYDGDDLFQTGCIGLIKAIDRFDCSLGLQFSTYAVPMITGEIKRMLRDDGMIKVSRHLKEIWMKMYSVSESYISEHGEQPSASILAQLLGVTEEEIIMASDAARPPDSFERELGEEGKTTLGDTLESGCDTENKSLNRITINSAMRSFSVRDQQIIALRYFYDKTQAQVATIMGISQVQVSRIEKKLLLQMREKLCD